MYKLLIILSTLWFLVLCSNTSLANLNSVFLQTKKYFTLFSATSQTHSGGARGSSSGIQYYFSVVLNTKVPIHFDSAWIRNKGFRITFFKKGRIVSNQPISYTKGDTLILSFSDVFPHKNKIL